MGFATSLDSIVETWYDLIGSEEFEQEQAEDEMDEHISSQKDNAEEDSN